METVNISPKALPKAYRYYFNRNFSRNELIESIIEEIKQSKAYQEFIKPYDNRDVESWMRPYAERKASVLLDFNSTRDQIEYHDSLFKSYAEDSIWEIQQKKLFDLQCRWRAEEIKIPGIECTWDFHFWSDNIEHCPFLEPITKLEVDQYIDFLKATDEAIDYNEFQNYSEFKENYENNNEGTELPEWYQYHNMLTGNQRLLALPDIRGAKEEYYKDIWHKDAEAKRTDSSPPNNFPFYDDDLCESLFNAIETNEFKKMHGEFYKMKDVIESKEIGDTYYFLSQLYEDVPVEASSDWRTALLNAETRYVNKKTAQEMTSVFEEYQMKLSLSISTGTTEGGQNRNLYDDCKRPILNGRKLNGEPEDFNF
jgi:hypothetical protein